MNSSILCASETPALDSPQVEPETHCFSLSISLSIIIFCAGKQGRAGALHSLATFYAVRFSRFPVNSRT
jgi:hypothetical protein